jgi:hypothetical protein
MLVFSPARRRWARVRAFCAGEHTGDDYFFCQVLFMGHAFFSNKKAIRLPDGSCVLILVVGTSTTAGDLLTGFAKC